MFNRKGMIKQAMVYSLRQPTKRKYDATLTKKMQSSCFKSIVQGSVCTKITAYTNMKKDGIEKMIVGNIL